MSCGRKGHSGSWAGSWTGSSHQGMPLMSGFAADLTAWARSSQLRVGDAERESAVQALGDHYAAGRLSQEEFDERSTAAWSARTAGDLTVLFGDLPRPHATLGPPVQPLARRPRRPRFPLLPALALSLAVALLTPVPFFVVLLLAWVAFAWMVRPALMRRHASADHGWGQTSGSRRAARGTWT